MIDKKISSKILLLIFYFKEYFGYSMLIILLEATKEDVKMKFCEAKEASKKIISSFLEERERKRAERENYGKNLEILQMIAMAKENLSVARNNFNYATDDKLLEYRIFELKAAESRLSYFLKMAKDKNISCGVFENYDDSGRRVVL